MSAQNLPHGCQPGDIDGPPMPRCDKCGHEHNDEKESGLCPECTEEAERIDAEEDAWHRRGEIG